jgi:hypothetical protein
MYIEDVSITFAYTVGQNPTVSTTLIIRPLLKDGFED